MVEEKEHRDRRGAIFILYASVINLIYGLSILLSDKGLGTTGIHGLSVVFGRYPLAIIFITTALLAAYALQIGHLRGFLLQIPQMLLFWASGATAVYAIATSMYADGVRRPRLFIATDQASKIVLAIFYGWLLVDIAVGEQLKHE